MEHIHGSYESTNRFRINPFSRAIINESEVEIAIAQYDHNSERFIFELPKMVEEHDMASCSAIRIHFINAGSSGKAEKDVYVVTDLAVSEEDPDVVTFSWLLSKKATSLDGVLSFAIQFICATDNEIDYSWSTLPFKSIKVPETYDNSEDIVEEDYSDILEKWKEELFADFNISVNDYYTKDEVYTKEETHSIVSEAVADLVDSSVETLDTLNELADALGDDPNFATTTLELIGKKANSADVYTTKQVDDKFEDFNDINAIKSYASGEIVRVDDVSTMEHVVKAKISSKNLVPYPYHHTNGNSEAGGTFTPQADGGVVLSGTPTGYTYMHLYNGVCLEKNDKITISLQGEFTNVVFDFAMFDAAGTVIFTISTTREGHVRTVNTKDYPTAAKWTFSIKREYNNVEMTGLAYPKIELGDMATEYEPYVDVSTATVTRCGKNLIPYPYKATVFTSNGITFTPLEDGGVSVKGTNTGDTAVFKVTGGTMEYNKALLIPKGVYYVSGRSSNVRIVVRYYTDSGTKNEYFDAPTMLEITKPDCRYELYLQVNAGVTVNNEVVYPLLEKGNIATDYELYKGVTYTPTANGMVEIDSIAPTMTIFTDNSRAIIDLEYHQDHNKAMNDVRADITTLDNDLADIKTTLGDLETLLGGI